MQHEYLIAQRAKQIALEGQAMLGGIILALIEDCDARSTLGFGSVHRKIGVA